MKKNMDKAGVKVKMFGRMNETNFVLKSWSFIFMMQESVYVKKRKIFHKHYQK